MRFFFIYVSFIEFLVSKDDIIVEKPPKHFEEDSNSLNKGISIRDDSSLLKDAIVKSKNASIQPNNVSIQPNPIATPMSSGSDLDQRK